MRCSPLKLNAPLGQTARQAPQKMQRPMSNTGVRARPSGQAEPGSSAPVGQASKQARQSPQSTSVSAGRP